MPMKGRKPKPTYLKILEGNPGKRPLKEHPKPEPIAPSCPYWLSPRAKSEWRRIAPELEKLGLLTKLDRTALAGYCENLALVKIASQAIQEYYRQHGKLTYTYVNKSGAENEVPIPEIKIAREAWQLVHKFETEFGLTPSSRERLNLPEQKEIDEFEEFLRGGQA
jgi:P27 family predicted phage terminase small subunit